MSVLEVFVEMSDPFLPNVPPPANQRRAVERYSLRVVGAVLLVFSIVFTGGSIWYTWDRAANSVEVDAVVTRWGETALVVRFTTVDGRVVRTSVDEPGPIENYPVGDTIRVQYLSHDPTTARAAEDADTGPILIVFGVVVLLISISMCAYGWRHAPGRTNRRHR